MHKALSLPKIISIVVHTLFKHKTYCILAEVLKLQESVSLREDRINFLACGLLGQKHNKPCKSYFSSGPRNVPLDLPCNAKLNGHGASECANSNPQGNNR